MYKYRGSTVQYPVYILLFYGAVSCTYTVVLRCNILCTYNIVLCEQYPVHILWFYGPVHIMLLYGAVSCTYNVVLCEQYPVQIMWFYVAVICTYTVILRSSILYVYCCSTALYLVHVLRFYTEQYPVLILCSTEQYPVQMLWFYGAVFCTYTMALRSRILHINCGSTEQYPVYILWFYGAVSCTYTLVLRSSILYIYCGSTEQYPVHIYCGSTE